MSPHEETETRISGPPRRRRDILLRWGVVIVALVGLAAIAFPFLPEFSRYPAQALHGAQQITMALQLYAADNEGIYPDERLQKLNSSNAVFDELLKDGIVGSEHLFGGARSVFQPDGDPATSLAALPDQVHWAIVTGRNQASSGGSPIIFENPVDQVGIGSPIWGPPGTEERGRSWKGRRIIIGTNDGGVHFYKLQRGNFQVDHAENADPFLLPDPKTGKPEQLPWVGGQ